MQRITLKIAGREYEMNMSTPEMEHLTRNGADRINAELRQLNDDYPNAPYEDKISVIALRQAATIIDLQNRVAALQKDMQSLKNDLEAYLSGIKD